MHFAIIPRPDARSHNYLYLFVVFAWRLAAALIAAVTAKSVLSWGAGGGGGGGQVGHTRACIAITSDLSFILYRIFVWPPYPTCGGGAMVAHAPAECLINWPVCARPAERPNIGTHTSAAIESPPFWRFCGLDALSMQMCTRAGGRTHPHLKLVCICIRAVRVCVCTYLRILECAAARRPVYVLQLLAVFMLAGPCVNLSVGSVLRKHN